MTRVALIGVGEVGRIIHDDLAAAGVRDLHAWDTAFDDPGSPAARNATVTSVRMAADAGSIALEAEDAGVEPAMSRAAARRQRVAAGCRAAVGAASSGAMLDAMLARSRRTTGALG